MAIQSSEAIVLNRIPLGDTSLLVTVYARAFGKVKLVARGARRPKSRMASSLQPFCVITVSFNRRENRELQHLSRVEPGPFFRHIGEDLTKVGYASAVCELVNRLVLGEEPGEQLFGLIMRTLEAIDRLPAAACEMLFWRFQLEFADIYGTGPEFSACMGCGRRPEEASVRFSPSLGGILCRDCQAQDGEAMQLSLGTTRLLSRVREMPLEHLSRLKPVRTSRQEIQRAIRAFYLYQMDDGRELKSLKFLESIEADGKENHR
ncbi:MAG: DNA repair protein RecO [Gemmatimonadetes bacterium]|nr:DNA repair protein RecO [Gemmatimonadota bacterium]